MSARFVLFALLLAAGWVVAAPGPPVAPEKETAVFSRDVRCRQFVATCLVEGRPARLMVDTGATHTVLAADFVAQQLPGLRFVEGVRLSGNAEEAPRLALAALQAGDVALAASPVLVMGLEGVNAMLGRRVDGILGMAHLVRLPFTLDLRGGGRGYWGEPAESMPLRPLAGQCDEAGRMFLDARCGESDCRLLLDTGSTVTTWPAGQWPAGEKETLPVQVGDVNGARSERLAYGLPAPLRLGESLVLPPVSPQLRPGVAGHVLGLDAFEGGVLVYRPGRGFWLWLPPASKQAP